VWFNVCKVFLNGDQRPPSINKKLSENRNKFVYERKTTPVYGRQKKKQNPDTACIMTKHDNHPKYAKQFGSPQAKLSQSMATIQAGAV
jgi:hypothetical protein